jgi:hypothetical protein
MDFETDDVEALVAACLELFQKCLRQPDVRWVGPPESPLFSRRIRGSRPWRIRERVGLEPIELVLSLIIPLEIRARARNRHRTA